MFHTCQQHTSVNTVHIPHTPVNIYMLTLYVFHTSQHLYYAQVRAGLIQLAFQGQRILKYLMKTPPKHWVFFNYSTTATTIVHPNDLGGRTTQDWVSGVAGVAGRGRGSGQAAWDHHSADEETKWTQITRHLDPPHRPLTLRPGQRRWSLWPTGAGGWPAGRHTCAACGWSQGRYRRMTKTMRNSCPGFLEQLRTTSAEHVTPHQTADGTPKITR